MFLEASPGHFQQRLGGIIVGHARTSEDLEGALGDYSSNCSVGALRPRMTERWLWPSVMVVS
jgi:hypothetical protein